MVLYCMCPGGTDYTERKLSYSALHILQTIYLYVDLAWAGDFCLSNQRKNR